MSSSELQAEEREVLLSIYDGDHRFKDISPTIYQYKYGEDNQTKSFLLEISWTPQYPNEKPAFNMNTFYNKHIAEEVKSKIIELLETEAEGLLGEAMTYSLFEAIKWREAELTEAQPEEVELAAATLEQDLGSVSLDQDSRKGEKKVQMTKAQKRRAWDRADHKGELPRGWNWVDIVKHLSQTGSKDSDSPLT